MKPILTHHLKPTTSRGERVRATLNGLSSVTPFNPSLTKLQNHVQAAQSLARKHNLPGLWIGAEYNNGYVFVNSHHAGPQFIV